MLRRHMRAIFTDASTLGVVMGDMNLQGDSSIDGVKQFGSIGKIQHCDHHPKENYLESCYKGVHPSKKKLAFR